MQRCLSEIRKEYYRLTGRKRIRMVGRKKQLPCPVGGCSFHGLKLKKHLMSKGHSLEEKSARLIESYLLHKIKHLYKVNKHKQNKPVICRKCSKCLDRIDYHLTGYHQMHRGSDNLIKKQTNVKKLQKNMTKSFSQIFLAESKKKKQKLMGVNLLVKQLKHVKLLVKQAKLLKHKK